MEQSQEKDLQVKHSSFLDRAKDYLKKKKTQALGATILAGTMAVAGCATGGLERRLYTVDDFHRGKLVTLTGEVHESYVEDKKSMDLNVPYIVYNSADNEGRPIVVNLHEDFRHGINRQAITKAKEALASREYAVRVYGAMTYSDVLNVDVDFLSFTDKNGKLALTIETDYDPIITVTGIVGNWPINPNPNMSFGLMPGWNWLGWEGFSPFFLSNWISWAWAWADWDYDGIINRFDSYPYINNSSGLPFKEGLPNPGFHNIYAGLNLHNAMSEKEGKAKLIIPEEGARLHPVFVDLFAKNKQAETYRQQVVEARDKIVQNYQGDSARSGSQGSQPRAKTTIPSLEAVARQMGIKREQMGKSYNNTRILVPTMDGGMINRGAGSAAYTGGASSGGVVTGSSSGGYSIPSAGSASTRGEAGARSTGAQGGKSGTSEKK
ncbi:hypothetical protein JXB28_02190 [Candidatus Woesearchaeota archaeon]|nr:hypothetical protein [Candidatus Woesearchaeota archaeon]